MATTEGLMRRTSSGRASSCAATRETCAKRKRKIRSNLLRFIQLENSLQPCERQRLHALNNILEFHVFGSLRTTVEKFYETVCDFLANCDAVGDADQVSIFELDARPLVSVIKENIKP